MYVELENQFYLLELFRWYLMNGWLPPYTTCCCWWWLAVACPTLGIELGPRARGKGGETKTRLQIPMLLPPHNNCILHENHTPVLAYPDYVPCIMLLGPWILWFCMFQHDTGNVHMKFVLGSPLMFHLLGNLDLAFLGPVLFVGKLGLVKGWSWLR